MTPTTALEPVSLAASTLEADGDMLYEVVNGQLVEKPPMSAHGTRLAFRIAKQLDVFGEAHQAGRGGMEHIFLIDPATNLQRRPDACFVSFRRWPADRELPHTDPWPVVPELAAEIVSKSNSSEDVIDKLHEYFRAGVQLVWVIYPRAREIYVYESPTKVRILTATEELDGGTVLPGFRLPLASLFLEIP